MASLALAVVLMLQITALLRLDDAAPLALVIAAFWGRMAPLWAMGRFPYLRADGTAGFHRRHARPAWDALPGLMALLGSGHGGGCPGHRFWPVLRWRSWWRSDWAGASVAIPETAMALLWC